MRARRSAVDRFLRKEEASGSNPDESIGATEFYEGARMDESSASEASAWI